MIIVEMITTVLQLPHYLKKGETNPTLLPVLMPNANWFSCRVKFFYKLLLAPTSQSTKIFLSAC